jgi:quercetin dioxygenase-like cupin family protein
VNGAATLALFELDTRAARRQRISIMLLMRIDRWDVRRDGPLSDTALRHKIEALGYSASACTYAAEGVAGVQTDARERLQAVSRGLVKVTIDGEAAILAAGDIVFVPAGAVHRVEVVGTTDAQGFEAFDLGAD